MINLKFKYGVKMTLKDVIKDARLKRSMKQEEAAELVGVTVQTYSKWENGKTEPKASQVAKLSEILGVSTSEICNGSTSKKLEAMQFMSMVSKISKGISDFDFKMAIWESIDNDQLFLDNLKNRKTVSERDIVFDEDDYRRLCYKKDKEKDPSLYDEDIEIENHLIDQEEEIELQLNLTSQQRKILERIIKRNQIKQ